MKHYRDDRVPPRYVSPTGTRTAFLIMNDKASASADIRTLGLLLTDDFALMSYASIIEPFRAANNLSGKRLYAWIHISRDGKAVSASNGAGILPNQKVGDALNCNTLFVFAGGDPASYTDASTFNWLRELANSGVNIAGVSGGPFLLARAGLLDGYRATIHWEHAAAMRETFPNLAIESGLYIIDRRRMTCAGGTAGLDLAIELIERDHGSTLAHRVSEWFIHTESRRAERPQRKGLRERYNVNNDKVLRVLAAMESTIEEPRSRDALAKIASVSLRQLERLFKTHLNSTVSETYLAIRLDQAEQLLRATSLSVTAVAVACGFNSASHFSRVFRTRFGKAPSSAR